MAQTGGLPKTLQKLPSLAQAAKHDLGRPLQSGQFGPQNERHKTTSARGAYFRSCSLHSLFDLAQAVRCSCRPTLRVSNRGQFGVSAS